MRKQATSSFYVINFQVEIRGTLGAAAAQPAASAWRRDLEVVGLDVQNTMIENVPTHKIARE